jgi:hypothetical protein
MWKPMSISETDLFRSGKFNEGVTEKLILDVR